MHTSVIAFFRACFVLGALLLAAVPTVAPAQQVGVRISIHLSAESAEVLRAWRRAQNLDPPDAAADARLRERLAAAMQDPNAAARERRRQRTVELVPIEGAEAGLQSGLCAPLPAETDACTRVVNYLGTNSTLVVTGR